MTIYIDIVFLENIIMNYIIILATGLIIKNKINHVRITIAAVIGAIYTVIAYITELKIYSNIILKFVLSLIIVYVAYNPQNIAKLWKNILFFYLTSFLFGGVAFALIYVLKPQNILMRYGLFLGTYPLKIVAISAIVAFLIIIFCSKLIKNKIMKKNIYCKIKIYMNEKTVETVAMIDTGNFLREPITNVPVVVVERMVLYDILPKEILNNIEEILGGDLKKIPKEIQDKYNSRLRLIPFSSLGKENRNVVRNKAKIYRNN